MPENPTDANAALTSTSLRGEVARVVYENSENGYCVFKVTDHQGVEHTATGVVHGLCAGQHVEMTGKWENHREFGRQLKIESCKSILPNTPEGIRRYLASGIIPGVGPKLAGCIVDQFGDKTLEIMDRYSARLLEIPGLGRKRLESIKEAWESQRSRRDLFIFMQSLGISQAYGNRIYKTYGNAAADIIRNSTYKLADDVDGIGFTLADRIAAALGVDPQSQERVAAGIAYSLSQLRLAGHSCYPRDAFIAYAAEILAVPAELVEQCLQLAEQQHRVVIDSSAPGEPMVFERGMYKAEAELPSHIARLLSSTRFRAQNIARVPVVPGQVFTDEQYRAVNNLAQSAVSIITGGPGVGKTTVISEIVRRALIAKLKIMLAAPTGRAAQRLSDSSGINARTIHRLLKWDPREKRFVYGLKYKLNCDLLIVDEVSMLDIPLAVHLLRAIPSGAALVMVGDADQLPSVGPGEVLNDFINSGVFPVARLTKIFRQGAGSHIITNAHAVNAGKLPRPEKRQDGELDDFYWIEQDDPELAVDQIVRVACERVPARFGFDPMRDIQILSPMNRGSCGTQTLNHILQERLNPGPKPQFKFGETTFRSGDRVMQTSNNYDKSVFNGDMGRLTHIDSHGATFKISFDSRQVEYSFTEADQLALAYAITVHKSQGSEFPVVIIPILNQHYMMLQRNLLYTAMTRAKKLLVLIGSRKAVSMAVNNSIREPRHSLLLHRLRALPPS